jgi:DHA2 family multidrug resistance protein
MSGSLGATIEQITWVVTAYLLAMVIIMPIIALLGARFGRKRVYMISVAAFTLGSMACGIASTLTSIIVFRIIQGAGGGVLMTVSQAILRESFPAEEQGMAMGVYGMGVVLAPAFGPTLGGWLTDQYSWPWIFFINVPIGILNLALVQRFIFDPPYLVREKGVIDWTGLGLMAVGLGSLQVMLEQGERGERENWFESAYIAALDVIAALGLLLFIWRELATRHPAVDLRILSNGSFASATAIGGVLGMGLYGSLFLLPLFLQNLLGYPAFKSGLALMPRSLAMALCMPIAGRLYNRLGPRVMVGVWPAASYWGRWSACAIWDSTLNRRWIGLSRSSTFA